MTHKEAINLIFENFNQSHPSVSEVGAIIKEYANQKALHIAEQAVGEEKKDAKNRGDIHTAYYTSDSILSRIKQLTEAE